MNTRSVLIAAVCLVLSSPPTRAHERLQGPTEVLYWDKAQTYTGYTFRPQ